MLFYVWWGWLLAKDYPHHVFRPFPILKVRGRGSIRGAQGRGSGSHGGDHGATILSWVIDSAMLYPPYLK